MELWKPGLIHFSAVFVTLAVAESQSCDHNVILEDKLDNWKFSDYKNKNHSLKTVQLFWYAFLFNLITAALDCVNYRPMLYRVVQKINS